MTATTIEQLCQQIEDISARIDVIMAQRDAAQGQLAMIGHVVNASMDAALKVAAVRELVRPRDDDDHAH